LEVFILDTIEINDDEINVEDIMQRIRENIKRRKESGEYTKADEKRLCEQAENCDFLYGWHDAEDWNGRPTRWMGDDAILVINSDSTRTAELSFQAISFRNSKTLRMSDGNLQDVLQIVPTSLAPIKVPISLKEGPNIIRFKILEGGERPCDIPEMNSEDGRCLGIAIQSVLVQNMSGDAKSATSCNSNIEPLFFTPEVIDVSSTKRYLQEINSKWDIENNSYTIASNRPVTGKFLIKGRELVHGEVRRYVDPMIWKQKEFNTGVVNSLNDTVQKIDILAQRLLELGQAYSQNKADLDNEVDHRVDDVKAEIAIEIGTLAAAKEDLNDRISNVRSETINELSGQIAQAKADTLEEINERISQISLENSKDLGVSLNRVKNESFVELNKRVAQTKLDIERDLSYRIQETKSEIIQDNSDRIDKTKTEIDEKILDRSTLIKTEASEEIKNSLSQVREEISEKLKGGISQVKAEVGQNTTNALGQARTEISGEINSNIAQAKTEIAGQLNQSMADIGTALESRIAQAKAEVLGEVEGRVANVTAEVGQNTTNALGQVRSEMGTELSNQVSQAKNEVNLRFAGQIGELRSEIDQQVDERVKDAVAAMDDDLGKKAWLAGVLEKRSDTIKDLSASPGSNDTGINYFVFEERFRGPRKEIKQRQSAFLEYFKGCKDVLDIGCGRGEFLELLKESGIEAQGVDMDEDMVNYSRSRGLKVTHTDAVSFLDGLADKSLDGIFLGQVVEHMEPAYLVKILELCYRKLNYGYHVVIETVNPLSLTSLANFYIDITHKRPMHPETLRFLLGSVAFREIEVKFHSPVPNEQRLKKVSGDNLEAAFKTLVEIHNKNVEMLNNSLYGSQDYLIIGKK
jgi:2-polyprenyl-3-methyl-5-hydroxy-6-metoxy-1,4-benzoquinol methylase